MGFGEIEIRDRMCWAEARAGSLQVSRQNAPGAPELQGKRAILEFGGAILKMRLMMMLRRRLRGGALVMLGLAMLGLAAPQGSFGQKKTKKGDQTDNSIPMPPMPAA